MGRMSKRQQASFEKLMQKIAKVSNTDVDALKKQHEINDIYTDDDRFYEAQAVYNFYRARVEPFITKNEKPENFDKRYREWRIRTCEGCGEEFAYAFAYEGVKFCSLECLEAGLAAIGIKYSRHHDLKRRWGHFHHPAIVPSSALEALKTVYQEYVPESFSPDSSNLPSPRLPNDEEHTGGTEELQDSPNSSYAQT